ncbi:MAG: class I SAM-dependent methyltransferase [Candidatus Limnocylindria bacterium]
MTRGEPAQARASTSSGASLDELLAEAASRPVSGWDFGWLGDRMVTAALPWSFEEIAERHARSSPDLLDMETGGGERLAAMGWRPARTVATEAWPPNVDVAGARLRPLGVTVVRDEGAPDNVDQVAGDGRGRLPFPSASFVLITNRHGTYVPSEVERILTAGGAFITEQIGGDYTDFHDALGLARPARSRPRFDVRFATAQVERAGLRVVDGAEADETTTFADAGAIAWYLRAVPWAVPGFAVDAHRAGLALLHERMRAEGPVSVRQPAFWLHAVKNGR